MKDFLKSKLFSYLLCAIVLITLFPPYNWTLTESLSKHEKRRMEYKYGSVLPYKSHDFIFASTTQRIDLGGWTWDGSQSVHALVPLERSIILSELFLYYGILCLVFYLIFINEEAIVSIIRNLLRKNEA
jgi:hypothetical protein